MPNPEEVLRDIRAKKGIDPEEALRRVRADRSLLSLPQQDTPGVVARAGRAVIEGGREALDSIPAAAKAIVGIPGQVYSDVKNLVNDPVPTLKEWAGRAARFAPPAIGWTGGALVGGLPGAIAGGTLGTLAVQRVESGEIPTAEDAIREATASALLGRAGQVIPRAVKGTVKAALGPRSIIPGLASGAAPEFHSLAAPRINKLVADLRPTDAAIDTAYNNVRSKYGSVNVPMTEVQSWVAKQLARERRATPPFRRPEIIESLDEIATDTAGGWDFQQLMQNVQNLGAKLGSMPDEPKGIARLNAKQRAGLLSAMHADVDALQGPESIEWAQARRLFKRREAANTLQKYVDSGTNIVSDQHNQLNVNKMLNGIEDAEKAAARGNRSAKLFVRSFDPGELREVKQTFRDVAKDLPRIRAAAGAPTGSSQKVLQGAVGRVAAGVAGQVIGHKVGTDMGWAAGVFAPELMSQAMMTRAGRAMVRTAIKIDPTTGPVFTNTMAAFLRTQASQERGDDPPDFTSPPPRPVPTAQTAVPSPTPTIAPVPKPTPKPTRDPFLTAVEH